MHLFAIIAGILLMSIIDTPTHRTGGKADELRLLTDFTAASPDLGWYVLNDNVMGGRSEGGFEQTPGELRFSGRTDTDGGGFSSIRTASLDLDLSHYSGLRLRVRGDGRRYTFRLTTKARRYGRPVAYWADFDTVDGEWRAVDVPFSRFIPRFRGAELDGPPLDAAAITGMGLMIYDKRDGPFELRLASVHAYAGRSSFSLERFRSGKRVLVLSAGGRDDADFAKQLDDIAASEAAFADRDLVVLRLVSDAASYAGEFELSNEEAADLRAALGIRAGTFTLLLIGKDGTVKLNSGAAVPMAEIYTLIDGMPMRRGEIRDRERR
jgi:monofunctional biosynthetic peptidoglycan transglycosylase